ncbi:hypothetical protein BJ165DRAFT_862722 [Panaeolus papilionaceus]|nr:hypothetical protein BJ165DRAFT_862722 [Panaeolus papilionaceus]
MAGFQPNVSPPLNNNTNPASAVVDTILPTDDATQDQSTPRKGFLIAMLGLSLFIIVCWMYYSLRTRFRTTPPPRDYEKGPAYPFAQNPGVRPPVGTQAQHPKVPIHLPMPTQAQARLQSPEYPPPPINSEESFRPRSFNSLFSGYFSSGNRGGSYPLLPEKPEKATLRNLWGSRRSIAKSGLGNAQVSNAPVPGASIGVMPPVPEIRINGTAGFEPFRGPPPSYHGSAHATPVAASMYSAPVATAPALGSNNPYTGMA